MGHTLIPVTHEGAIFTVVGVVSVGLVHLGRVGLQHRDVLVVRTKTLRRLVRPLLTSSVGTPACRYLIADFEQMARLLFLFLVCALTLSNLLGRNAFAGSISITPRCFAGFCLHDSKIITEKAVRSRFGGSKQTVFPHDFEYCYRFIAPNHKSSYGHFLFKDFGGGSQLVTISSSWEPLCNKAHDVKVKSPLVTKEGIGLGHSEAAVLQHYGWPHHKLHSPPAEEVSDLFGDSKINIDVINLYVPSDDELLSARFFISDERVVGIVISVDE